ncbi:MAG: Asp-tRNA(Asn)/Glu-tRNA(Gln) amidotransferase subunit GatB [Deltaproteobacteria bacterium]|nr:Asp-tRNA(Asn)/Glu-tRNA(Gln) amidotransferase subunit GatB [Deltaproteobacteria bacterium]
MKYEAVIGLEVHCQLLTETKLFCGCRTKFGAAPNTQVCPVCLGMPGVLPVLNKKAVEFAVKTALALDCRINERSIFARKNYFYPDLPKSYQISQYMEPFCEKGFLDIEDDGKTKRIGITRIHMEEDAGKLLHGDTPDDDGSSFVDLNRACVPLIEIVSEPDMRTALEASAYLRALRDIVVYLGVCDGNMEEGSFRCDANVSVRPVGTEKFGTRAELKNINSFKFVKDAIDYEIDRQIDLIESNGKVIQETRLFDSAKGITVSMRSKEEAHDYRYFPEPDLSPLIITKELIEEMRKTLPELPQAKRRRFVSVYGIPAYDAGVLTAEKALADYYEAVVKETGEPKISSNWVMGELLPLLEANGYSTLTPATSGSVINMVKSGAINAKTAKEVLKEASKTGKSPEEIVKVSGAGQISGEEELLKLIDAVIAANPDNLARYKAGKDKLFGFFVGETMKAAKGQANPAVLNKLLKERLGS